MPAGRPSKYNKSYCDEVISCLEQGHSLTAFAGEIGVNPDTLYEWQRVHPDFSDAVKRGRAKAVSFWEKTLIGIAQSNTGNATAAIFGLKNRAADDWRDKVETEHSGEVKHTGIERVIVKASPASD